MKYLVFLFLLCFFYCGCSRGKYFVTNNFHREKFSSNDILELDSTYRFYLREVYKDKNLNNENVLKTNVDKKDTANKVRIEVEYLLLSWKHRNAIYISTIPDKYQHYYSANRFADTLINAYDFSTFHFGRIANDGESISFLSKDQSKLVTWDIRPFIANTDPLKITIREIAVQRKELLENVILINKALEEPIWFRKQKSFTVIFEKPGKLSGDSLHTGYCTLLDKRIYINSSNHSVELFLRFNRNITDSKDSVIGFDDRRTRYSPVKPEQNFSDFFFVPTW